MTVQYTPCVSDYEVVVPDEWSRMVISGYPGSGKTTLGRILVEDYDVLRIDASELYGGLKVAETLLRHRTTKDVLGILRGIVKPKAVLFDDVDVFHRHDKKLFDRICSSFEDKTDKRKMILVCSQGFSKNRRLLKQRDGITRLRVHYSEECYSRCLKNILRLNGIRCSGGRLSMLAKLDNFHRIYEAIEYHNTHGTFVTDIRDYQDTRSPVINRLLSMTTIDDILRHSSSDTAIIGLTLLEATSRVLPPGYDLAKHMTSVYQDAVRGDMMDTRINRYNLWDLREISGLLSVYAPIRMIKEHSDRDPKETFAYTTYLSRGMSIIHNRGILRALDHSMETILQTLSRRYGISELDVDELVMTYIRGLEARELRLMCQAYSKIYHQRITLKMIIA